MIGPSLILAAVVALFHVSLLVAIRGRVPARLAFVAVGALLGAWAGDAVGGRIGDLWRIGDFSVLWASVLAWVGIGVVSTVGEIAVPAREEKRR